MPVLLLDATHTSHTDAHTGIQRVVRSLGAALSAAQGVQPVCFDPYLEAWRELNGPEKARLAAIPGAPARSRGSRWPIGVRWAGRIRRLTGRVPAPPAGTGLVCPELFSAHVGGALPGLRARVSGPRVAIFHDAIALKFPEFTPAKTVGRFPSYLGELLGFDGIAAVSRDSAACLGAYWDWLGVRDRPPVQTISLGLDDGHLPDDNGGGPAGRSRVLCVGTLEARKNHLALLRACEQLWREGGDFELHLIGGVQRETGHAALEEIQRLQAAGRPLRFDGPVGEEQLQAAYRGCTFTVYPSLNEGFGLPVMESLSHGKPCVCSGRGALGEISRGGGCLPLESVDAGSLAAALRKLLTEPPLRAHLAAAARARSFKSWADYATELTGWMETLPRR